MNDQKKSPKSTLRDMTRYAKRDDPIYQSGLSTSGVKLNRASFHDESHLSQELRDDDIVQYLIHMNIPITRQNWLNIRYGLGSEGEDRNEPNEVAWLDRNFPEK
jgi:hypothetical protein